jgi:hypothetical protein
MFDYFFDTLHIKLKKWIRASTEKMLVFRILRARVIS